MEIRTINAIRAAVAAGRLAEAERLLAELRDEVESAWVSASSDVERQSIVAEVGDALEQARRVVLASRAHDKGNLIRLGNHKAYGKLANISDVIDFDA